LHRQRGRLRLFLLSLLAFSYPGSARADIPVMAGVAGPGVNLVYAYLAQDTGLWKKHGVDIKLLTFESGSTLAQVARSGEIKIAINSGPTTIASRAQGADAIIIASAVNTLPYSLVTVKGITNWDQLRGKKVGVSRFGSGTDTAIRLVCKKFGFDPAKDLIILQGGTQPTRLQALTAGALDATLLSPPLDFIAKKQGLAILVNVAQLGIPYPQLVIESTDRLNRESPKLVKGFLKGFIEAIYYGARHKDETKKIITKHLKISNSEILDATYESFIKVTDYSAEPNLDGIRNAIDEVALRVPAVKTKKPQEFIDLRFLKELQGEKFFKRLEN
jgi:ABC-type nitrate/sulfonate/bicarbonate transport system substrate-binding protein